MQKYFDSVLDREGNAISGASVLVADSDGNTATIYSDNSLTSQANPITTDVNGEFGFYAIDGTYSLTISGTNITTKTVSGILLDSESSAISSIAALKLIPGADDNQTVNVNGYYTAGDGGGGHFYWDADSTATANDGTIIQATGVTTGRWIRIYSGQINVKWFGWDTGATGAVNSAAAQAASDAISGLTINTQPRLIFPSGSYTVSSTIDIPKASVEFQNCTITAAAGFTGTYIFDATPSPGSEEWAIWSGDCVLDGNSKAVSGIYCGDYGRTFTGIEFVDCDIGYANKSWGNKVIGNTFTSCNFGIKDIATSSTDAWGGGVIQNNICRLNGVGIYLASGGVITVQNNIVQSSTTYEIQLDPVHNMGVINIKNNYIESPNDIISIYLGNVTYGVAGVNIDGNVIIGRVAHTTGRAIYANTRTEAKTINNNYFSQWPLAIQINDFYAGSVTNNHNLSVTSFITYLGVRMRIINNTGYTSENTGTATITSGNTSVTVTHGLSFTPGVKDINVTMTENPTNDPGNIWIDTITSTQFNINCRNDPGASNLDFTWIANHFN